MSQVPNNVKSLASKLLGTMKTASPNQGYGGLGQWPNEAAVQSEELTCELTNVSFKFDGKFAYGEGNNRKEIPALEVQCFYIWHEDPSGHGLSWRGSPVVIPYDQAGLPKNQQDRVRIAADRLKGIIQGLTGVAYDDIEVACNLITKMLNDAKASGASIWVKVWKSHTKREDKKTKQTRFNKEDFIREVVSGAAAVEDTGTSGDEGADVTEAETADSTGG